jgi:hypothetical protein
MADNNEKVIVIRKDKCSPDKSFNAAQGSEVEFQFPEEPDAVITFIGDSPFEDSGPFKPGRLGKKMRVKDKAKVTSYEYSIKWTREGGGSGNGGGKVTRGGH